MQSQAEAIQICAKALYDYQASMFVLLIVALIGYKNYCLVNWLKVYVANVTNSK